MKAQFAPFYESLKSSWAIRFFFFGPIGPSQDGRRTHRVSAGFAGSPSGEPANRAGLQIHRGRGLGFVVPRTDAEKPRLFHVSLASPPAFTFASPSWSLGEAKVKAGGATLLSSLSRAGALVLRTEILRNSPIRGTLPAPTASFSSWFHGQPRSIRFLRLPPPGLWRFVTSFSGWRLRGESDPVGRHDLLSVSTRSLIEHQLLHSSTDASKPELGRRAHLTHGFLADRPGAIRSPPTQPCSLVIHCRDRLAPSSFRALLVPQFVDSRRLVHT